MSGHRFGVVEVHPGAARPDRLWSVGIDVDFVPLDQR
jgi:hypothetical protein